MGFPSKLTNGAQSIADCVKSAAYSFVVGHYHDVSTSLIWSAHVAEAFIRTTALHPAGADLFLLSGRARATQ